MSDDKNSPPPKLWKAWGSPDDIRKLRGYSAATAVKPKEKKLKKKAKLRLVRGGKR